MNKTADICRSESENLALALTFLSFGVVMIFLCKNWLKRFLRTVGAFFVQEPTYRLF